MRLLMLAAVAAGFTATPALAVTNLIRNGSFEQAGTTGPGAFTGWTRTNTPDRSPSQDVPAIVINYDIAASYANGGAFGELVTPDNVANSGSPDAVGTRAAYFVGDFSFDETLSQLTFLRSGNYRVGFSYYLTQNGLNNAGNASLDVTILGIPVASTMITGSSVARTWFYATGVGQIVSPGFYQTALVFNSNGFPSKDVVVDRVFAFATTDPATTVIPALPEPGTWAMLVVGFGFIGFGLRRRRAVTVTA